MTAMTMTDTATDRSALPQQPPRRRPLVLTLIAAMALAGCGPTSSGEHADATGSAADVAGADATVTNAAGASTTNVDDHAAAPNADHAATSIAASATGTTPARWTPRPGATWQIQYEGDIDTSVEADVYFLDGEDTSAATVAALKAAGRRTVCYLNAGAVEVWRSDKKAFRAPLVGAAMSGWDGERWLDIRKTATLLPIMRARMERCRAKGFDGVDPDNVQGYAEKTGFPLTADDQLRYNRALADTAHSLGLAFGLKNDIEHIPELADTLNFAVNEECAQYHECGAYELIVQRNKPVFHVEYKGTLASVCAASPKGFSTILKTTDLTASREACPPS